MLGYVWRDLWRNPRRSLASLVGITLGVGLFSAVLFFNDGSGATLTKRAIAPLAVDVQAMLNAPLGRSLRFEERVDTPGALRAGEAARITLTLVNEAAVAVNEVVVNDEPPPPLTYVPGTTTIDGRPVPDVDGQIPLAQGVARTGLNVGTLAPSRTMTFQYTARAATPVEATTGLALQGRVSSREDVIPAPANSPPPRTLGQLQQEIGRIPGVAAADGLSYVDLPASSLRAGASVLGEPLRVFAFDARYRERYPSIRLAAGTLDPDGAALSAEAARALGVAPGGNVQLALPGGQPPLALPVSGVADLAQAKPLFYSRKSSKLEDFLYVPYVVIVSPATFARTVVPAFRTVAAAQGNVVKSLPVSEVDVLVTRSRLASDPGRALAQTKAVTAAIEQVAPGQASLIDNISNTLDVARDDAAVGKRMFVFLGLPGILLAVFLTSYAGTILAATQRREQAILRLRGADRRRLLRMLVAKAVALAVVGSAVGTGLGLLSAAAALGRSQLAVVAASDLTASALVALAAGVIATATALCLPGIRALHHEVNEERRELASSPTPAWRRWRLDVGLLAVAALAEAFAFASGGFDAPITSVSNGEPARLPSRLLLAPLLAWLGGTLLAVRLFTWVTARLPLPSPPRFGPVVRGTLFRSLRRRPWALATGTVGVGLVTAFGMALAMFAATYDDAKVVDSRFSVGADLRASPSVRSSVPRPTSSDATLLVDGVTSVAPVVFKLENSVLIAKFNQDRMDLAAVDAASFERTAPVASAFLDGETVEDVFEELRSDPEGLLVAAETADDLSIEVGDPVKVLLARGTEEQALRPFRVVGIFERLPGLPPGTDLVVNLATYQGATGLTAADFFLLRAADPSPRGLHRAEAALRSGPGRIEPLDVETTQTALDKDQSSLTALDINGLVDLDSLFATLMSGAAIGIFVFALLLHRRKEYVTLRAQGLPTEKLLALVLGEVAFVIVGGLMAGIAVGTGMAALLIHILRPLFILDPSQSFPISRLVLLAALPAAAAGASACAATASLRRLRPTEVLRDL